MQTEKAITARATRNGKACPEYNSYRAAKRRCTNPNATDYKYYGGRGIEFRFDSFGAFLLELGRKPSPKHTVDRINVNGHYEKGNVKWSTRLEQMNNVRRNHLITAFGKTLTVSEWSRQIGVTHKCILFREKMGWCNTCTLSTSAKTCTHNYNRNKFVRVMARKRINNNLITAHGKTLTQVEWSEISGLKQTTISMRIKHRGWCDNCAVALPVGQICPHKNNSFCC